MDAEKRQEHLPGDESPSADIDRLVPFPFFSPICILAEKLIFFYDIHFLILGTLPLPKYTFFSCRCLIWQNCLFRSKIWRPRKNTVKFSPSASLPKTQIFNKIPPHQSFPLEGLVTYLSSEPPLLLSFQKFSHRIIAIFFFPSSAEKNAQGKGLGPKKIHSPSRLPPAFLLLWLLSHAHIYQISRGRFPAENIAIFPSFL